MFRERGFVTKSTYLLCVLLASMGATIAYAQSADESDPANTNVARTATTNNVARPPHTEAKRLFGIIPNYRTEEFPNPYKPLSAEQKFRLATQDSFDRGTVILGAMFGGLDQITGSEKSFGGGVTAYGKYFATSYASFVIGDYMTEAIFPSLLHQDPRYFRRACCGWKRLGYAVGQVFWTHTDTGKGQFNYSEIIGNSVAVAISNAYYPSNRTASNAFSGLATQLGVDMASNVLKEFWPEIHRTFTRSHTSDDTR